MINYLVWVNQSLEVVSCRSGMQFKSVPCEMVNYLVWVIQSLEVHGKYLVYVWCVYIYFLSVHYKMVN